MATSQAAVWAFYRGKDVVDVTFGLIETIGVLTVGRERAELDPGAGMMVMVSRDTLRFVTDELPGIANGSTLTTTDADAVDTSWKVRELRVVNSDETEAVLVRAD